LKKVKAKVEVEAELRDKTKTFEVQSWKKLRVESQT
jgi:hypothetical protein